MCKKEVRHAIHPYLPWTRRLVLRSANSAARRRIRLVAHARSSTFGGALCLIARRRRTAVRDSMGTTLNKHVTDPATATGASLGLGVLILTLGIVAFALPPNAALAANFALGWLLLLAAVLQFTHAYEMRKQCGAAWHGAGVGPHQHRLRRPAARPPLRRCARDRAAPRRARLCCRRPHDRGRRL